MSKQISPSAGLERISWNLSVSHPASRVSCSFQQLGHAVQACDRVLPKDASQNAITGGIGGIGCRSILDLGCGQFCHWMSVEIAGPPDHMICAMDAMVSLECLALSSHISSIFDGIVVNDLGFLNTNQFKKLS